MTLGILVLVWLAGLLIALLVATWLLGFRYIPHNKVGIVEKLWSGKGSLKEGRILALGGEAGYQADLLRGGAHAFFFPWQYRIHLEPLVSIPESKIGYVYSRDGSPLTPVQTLGRVVDCTNFQDARRFLAGGGQRGRQRAILREGVYAINLALFVVVAEDRVYQGPVRERNQQLFADWQEQLREIGGFDPVVVGSGAPLREGRAPAGRPGGRERPRQHRRGHRARRPAHRIRRGHRPGGPRWCRRRRSRLLPGSRGAAGARRAARQTAAGADRRHVFRQPLVRHRRVPPENRHPDRLRRRGGVVLRQSRRRPDGRAVPLRRAGGAGTPRGVAQAPASRKVPAQPLRAQGRARADGELRSPLDQRA